MHIHHDLSRLIVAGIFILMSTAAVAAETLPAGHDIRILIDVSGSMKRNDPDNLRRPALRLLTELIPANSQAGVWTFGQYVNMLVPLATTDTAWKKNARDASQAIRSHGLFTNIEQTLADASWDWQAPDPGANRHMILLSDGLVDISADPALNLASRQRILNQLLPRIIQAGARIHTIALSSEADDVLLRQLAHSTQGLFEQISSPAHLERLFLRLFEQATQPDTLPLINNQIMVDSSIKELTLLIFHQTTGKETRVQLPDGSEYDHHSHPQNITWHQEQHYALITVQQPPAGTWTIIADVDPDNRVMVVTDLQLQMNTIASHLATTDTPQLSLSLRDNDGQITNKDFLYFINFSATLVHGQDSQQWTLMDNGLRGDSKASDGNYTLIIKPPHAPGQHELTIDIDGTTFKRQKKIYYEVHDKPVIASIRSSDHGDQALYITAIPEMINSNTLQASALIADTVHSIPRQHDNEWVLPLDDILPADVRQLTVTINGNRGDQPVNTEINVTLASTEAITAPQAETNEATTIIPTAAEATPAIAPSHDNAQFDQAEPATTDWLTTTIIIVLFNIALGVSGFFAYRFWRRQQQVNLLKEINFD